MFNEHSQIYIIIGVIIIAVIAIIFCRKTQRGRYAIDAIKLYVPILRDIERKKSLRQFALAYIDQLPKADALADACHAAINYISNLALRKRVSHAVTRGGDYSSVANTLEASGLFAPLIVEMVKTSEKQSVAARNNMLKKIAEFYKEEADAAASALTAIVEPVAICIAGALVFGVLALFYTGAFHGANR